MIAIAHFSILFLFYDINFNSAISDSVIFNTLYGIFGISLWYIVRYNDIDNLNLLNLLINHLTISLIITALWLSAGYLILDNFITHQGNYELFLNRSLPWRFIIGIFFYISFIFIYYLVIYYSNFQEKLINEEKLKTLVKETELNVLRSQINPHFLFNSLNSISSLTISNPEKAQEMIIKLSSFLRYSLSTNEKQKTYLKDELQNCLLYLDIEKIRFGDKLKYEKIIDKNSEEKLLPNLILQPLLENAIKHGVYESTEKIIITLKSYINKEYLIVKITNNYDSDILSDKGERIGLKNIRSRLRIIYNRDDLLKINDKNNLFEVTLYFPQ